MGCSAFLLLLQCLPKLCSAELLLEKPLIRWLLFSLGPCTPLWFLGLIYYFCAFHMSVNFVGLLFILPNIFLIFWVFYFPLLFSLPLPYTLHSVFYHQIPLCIMHLPFYLWHTQLAYFTVHIVFSYSDVNLERVLCFLFIGMHLKDGSLHTENILVILYMKKFVLLIV